MRPNERKACLAIALNVRIGSQTLLYCFLQALSQSYIIVSVMENVRIQIM